MISAMSEASTLTNALEPREALLLLVAGEREARCPGAAGWHDQSRASQSRELAAIWDRLGQSPPDAITPESGRRTPRIQAATGGLRLNQGGGSQNFALDGSFTDGWKFLNFSGIASTE